MVPRTSNQEGENALVQGGKEIGVQVSYYGNTPQSSSLQGVALMPKSGAELVTDFQPGIAGALIAGGFVLCMVAMLTKRRH